MLSLNLSNLGITEEALTKAILTELNLTPEQAVKKLAAALDVPLYDTDESVVTNGSLVKTASGVASAKIVSPDDLAKLAAARDVLNRIL